MDIACGLAGCEEQVEITNSGHEFWLAVNRILEHAELEPVKLSEAFLCERHHGERMAVRVAIDREFDQVLDSMVRAFVAVSCDQEEWKQTAVFRNAWTKWSGHIRARRHEIGEALDRARIGYKRRQAKGNARRSNHDL